MRQRKPNIRELIKHGTVGPHPKWTKEEVLKECSRMYHEVEALRQFIIDKALLKL